MPAEQLVPLAASAVAVPALPLHVPDVLIERAEADGPITEIGCDKERGEVAVKEEVAVFAKVLAPEKYGRLPMTAAVEV